MTTCNDSFMQTLLTHPATLVKWEGIEAPDSFLKSSQTLPLIGHIQFICAGYMHPKVAIYVLKN